MQSGTPGDPRVWKEIGVKLLASHRLRAALAAARSIGDDSRQRPEVVAALAPRLAAAGLPKQALAWVRELGDERRGEALAAMVPHLGGSLLDEALVLAQSISDARWKPVALAELSLRLAAWGRPSEALAVLRSIDAAAPKIRILGRIVAHLPDNLLSDALALTLTLVNERHSGDDIFRTLTSVIRRFVTKGRAAEALTAAWSITATGARTHVLSVLAPWLASFGRPAEMLANDEDPDRQAEILIAVAFQIDATQLDEALALARSIRDQDRRHRAWAALAPRFAASGRPEEALELVRAVSDQRPIYLGTGCDGALLAGPATGRIDGAGPDPRLR